MSSINGDFDINGQSYHYEIIEMHDYRGRDYTGDDIEDRLYEADQIFYVATHENGESYYRWVAGPYENIEQLVAAIEDELDQYEEV